MSVTVEICVASIDGAIAAARGGADRVELNSGLSLGGVTPSIGLVRAVVSELNIPVISMLRPRESGFCYSDNEFRVMRRDLDALLHAGVSGIAFGVLNGDGSIDSERCQMLVSQLGDHDAVFHRAFDVVRDADVALDLLKSIGVNRVMTSGLSQTAVVGSEVIRSLIARAGNEIEILAAGGIRSHNAADLIAATGCTQVHAAMLEERTDSSVVTDVSFSSERKNAEHVYSATDEAKVREFVQTLRGAS